MRRVIVNSTPMIALSKIGRLNILKKLYSEVTIPQAVFDEVTAKEDSPCRQIKDNSEWIKVIPVGESSDDRMYKSRLHAGEVEVMKLARQNPVADLVIIDDNEAKKTAKFLGLNVTGTIVVLIKAKKEGAIATVMPEIDKLAECGFYIDERLKEYIRNSCGEQ